MSSVELTPEQRATYEENGFLVIRGFWEPVDLKPFEERFLAIVEGEVPPGEGMLVMRDVMVAKGVVEPGTPAEAIAKIQDFENDPVLFEGYTKSSRLLDWVEAFIGPDIKSIHTMLINKPPNVDGRHPMHQDLLYFPFRPADSIVATSTAIERVTRQNGCLSVVPGSHKSELLRHDNPPHIKWLNHAYYGAVGVGAHPDRVHLEMEPGDIVFFHPLLLHGSGRNRTAGFRRMILTHYASARCVPLPDSRDSLARRPYSLVRGAEHEGCI
jgi:phytanoyl-CoA hydroxylase